MAARQPIATLNVESDSARLLCLKGRGRRSCTWRSAELPPGLMKETMVSDPAKLGRAIAGLLRKGGVTTGDVAVSLTGLRSVFRTVTLPRLKASQVGEAVKWAVRREMPVPAHELYLSWQVVSSTPDEMVVFLAGTPRALADGLRDALRKAGVRPRLMELKPLSLSRLSHRASAIIVDVESDSTCIIVLQGRLPRVVNISAGRKEGEALSDRLEKMEEDFSRTVGYYNGGDPGRSLSFDTPVLVTGGDSGSAAAFLDKHTPYAVQELAPPLDLPPGLPLPEYAVNIGLAARLLPPRGVGDLPASLMLNVLGQPRRGFWQRAWPWPAALGKRK